MSQFFRVNGDRWINKDMIRWVEQEATCFRICSRQNGCAPGDTFKICPGSPDFQRFLTVLGDGQSSKTEEGKRVPS